MTETRSSFGSTLSVAIHTDVGRVRNNNEDSSGQAWLDDGSLFCMVADGMGGHEAGEVASGLAVQVVQEVVGRDSDSDPRERLYNALLEANAAILEEGRRSGKHGMGTTSVCIIAKGAEVHVALVGDSRCYHIRNGHLVWRTVDHTRVQMLIDAGEIDEDEARVHPEAGQLTRALGHSRMADGRALLPDVLGEPLFLDANDALVLCSDGLHDLIEDWEIGRHVAGKDAANAGQALVELACDRGGHDNVTVAVVIAGKRSGDFDQHYSPPTKVSAELTYPGWSTEPAPAPPTMPIAQAVRPEAGPPAGLPGEASADDAKPAKNPMILYVVGGLAALLFLLFLLAAVLFIVFKYAL